LNDNIKDNTHQWIRESLIKRKFLNLEKHIEKNNEEINEKQKIIILLTSNFSFSIKSSLQPQNLPWIANSDSIQIKEDNEKLMFGIIREDSLDIHHDCLVHILEECDKSGNSPRRMVGNMISKYSKTDYSKGLLIRIPCIFGTDLYS
jgi:hypothetical protein